MNQGLLQGFLRAVFFALMLLVFGTFGIISVIILFVLGLVFFLLGSPAQIHVSRSRSDQQTDQFDTRPDQDVIEVEYKIEDDQDED